MSYLALVGAPAEKSRSQDGNWANSTLADLSAGANAAASSAAKDDPHGQTIALLGYMASSFVLPSDSQSGTPITDPQDQQHHLSLPHAG